MPTRRAFGGCFIRTAFDAVATIDQQFNYAEFDALARTYGSRASLAAYTRPDTVHVGTGDAATIVNASYTTAGYFTLLRPRLAAGRIFAKDEDRMGSPAQVAVVSYRFWKNHLLGDAAAVGHDVDIGLQRYTIVGVTADGFTGTDLDATDIWLPLSSLPAPDNGTPWYQRWNSGQDVRLIARVDHATPDRWLSSAGTASYRRGQLENHGFDTSATVLAGPLLESLGPSIEPRAEVAITRRLIGAMAIVLLIACANVANLLLTRARRREREIATRAALGASGRRLAAQFLSESLVLSLIAAVAAVFVAAWGSTALRSILMPTTHWAESGLDIRVIVFTVSVALITAVLTGLAPAIGARRGDLATALKTGARGGAFQRSPTRNALIVAQVALSVVLIAGAGLFVRSLRNVRAIDLGYDADRLVWASVQFADPQTHFVGSARFHREELKAGLEQAAVVLSRNPDVERVALASSAPMASYAMVAASYNDGRPTPRVANREAGQIAVSPEFLRTTGAELVRGRFFNDGDRSGTPPVIVVNETVARAYWPNGDAVGQCLVITPPSTSPCATIVGVVKDSHLLRIVEVPTAEFFSPIAQSELVVEDLVVRAAPHQATRVAETMRRELHRIFPQPTSLPYAIPLATRLEPQLRSWRLGAILFSAFGALAVVVAGVGVYSVMAYTFAQRMHEIGVRMALGAQARDVISLVLGNGMRVVGIGVIVGVGLALSAARLVASMLYGISARDPITLAGVAVLLLGVGGLASLLPAWRATRIDPVTALRDE